MPGWAGRARAIEPLEGGITNRNYRVTIDGERFVVRAPGEGTELLGIDRRHEDEAARQAAALGVGPEVVAFVDPPGSLVTRFLDGDTATSDALRREPLLHDVADLLRIVHAGPAISAVFGWYDVPLTYAATARSHGVTIPDALEQAMTVADQIRAAFAASAEPTCPCHNDLLAANFLVSPDGLRLVDWEYAGMNDRFFDLGNFAVNNDLDDAAEVALVDAYFGEVTTRRVARLRLMEVISDVREAMWGVVQAGVSTLDVDFLAYAGEHFERALANASRPEFRQMLVDAAADA
ncbi:MAG: phosphotransferase [Microthrixaceae bacterium]